MQFQDLQQIIERASVNTAIPAEVIIDDLAQIVKIKYGELILEKEREVIEELKNKIVTRLYNFEDHSISFSQIKKETAYKADSIEAPYIEKAEEELRAEGIVELKGNSIVLTNPGIVKYKSFYGEM
ncbi:MAG: hypothetical protein JJU28_11960 [Cyclobacteriaceae bacterium]|nr:hypothetical protein [Cyclobacteriaceae bacterium]